MSILSTHTHTHTHTTATVLGIVAVYMNYGMDLLNPRDIPPYLASFPARVGVMATLLWFLQPEFDITEVSLPSSLPLVSVCFAADWLHVGYSTRQVRVP